MRRYRRDDQVWEVALDGRDVRIRSGKVDGELSEEVIRFQEELRAHWEVDRLSAERAADGYELVAKDDQLATLSSVEFESALRAEPDRLDNYLVFGDWLESQGDPRGEIIAIQHALLSEPQRTVRRAELERREMTLLFRHRRRLWGELGGQVVSAGAQLYAADLFSIEWHLGFMRRVTFNLLALPDLDLGPMTFGQLMARLFALDTAALLQEMTILEFGERDPEVFRQIMVAMAEHAPPTLRGLSIGEPDRWIRIPHLHLPAGGLPTVETMALCAQELSPPERFSPTLADLELTLGEVGDELINVLAGTRWDALESFSLRLLREQLRYRGVRFDGAGLAPIVSGRTAPHLTSLTLQGTRDSDELCRQLASSQIAGQLTYLDLGFGTMTSIGAGYLVSAGLDRLETLIVHNNHLTSSDVQRLGHVARSVQGKPQAAVE